jgi:hypothetical protein
LLAIALIGAPFGMSRMMAGHSGHGVAAAQGHSDHGGHAGGAQHNKAGLVVCAACMASMPVLDEMATPTKFNEIRFSPPSQQFADFSQLPATPPPRIAIL